MRVPALLLHPLEGPLSLKYFVVGSASSEISRWPDCVNIVKFALTTPVIPSAYISIALATNHAQL